MFVHFYLRDPEDFQDRQAGRRKIHQDEEGSRVSLNYLPRELPGDLEEHIFTKVVIMANGICSPPVDDLWFPAEGAYLELYNDDQIPSYATVEITAEGESNLPKWFMRVEAASFERAVALYIDIRQGGATPVTPWKYLVSGARSSK
jgi:hypothetical protein